MWPHVQLCSVRTRMSAASSHSAGGGSSESWRWSKASCACRGSVSSIQLAALDSYPCVITPVGGCLWASCMHRRSCWAYARGSGFSSAILVICLCAASSAPYRLHVVRWGAGASVANRRTRCVLSSIGSSSSCMVSSWMSRLLGSVSGALCCRGGSLVASTSLILLWVDVCDGDICLSNGVSGVSHE